MVNIKTVGVVILAISLVLALTLCLHGYWLVGIILFLLIDRVAGVPQWAEDALIYGHRSFYLERPFEFRRDESDPFVTNWRIGWLRVCVGKDDEPWMNEIEDIESRIAAQKS